MDACFEGLQVLCFHSCEEELAHVLTGPSVGWWLPTEEKIWASPAWLHSSKLRATVARRPRGQVPGLQLLWERRHLCFIFENSVDKRTLLSLLSACVFIPLTFSEVFVFFCGYPASSTFVCLPTRCLLFPLQDYESKLQALQKQVETRSLAAETTEEEEEEEEEGELRVYS